MWEWLLAPIDPGRAHEVGVAVSWHARSMVLGWGIIAPLVVLFARFFKVLPGQDWPREVDNQLWWRTHWMGQTGVLVLSIIGFVLVLPADFSALSLHRTLGYAVLGLLMVQVLLGLFRGSKGGPTAPAADGSLRGHHYDMTSRRRAFELLHKSLGYGVLGVAACAILVGLWDANGPRWMWLCLAGWWLALVASFAMLQTRGMAVDTYQAIWGDDPAHPGNQMAHPGWGVTRATPGDNTKERADVRQDRGDRVRGQ